MGNSLKDISETKKLKFTLWLVVVTHLQALTDTSKVMIDSLRLTDNLNEHTASSK